MPQSARHGPVNRSAVHGAVVMALMPAAGLAQDPVLDEVTRTFLLEEAVVTMAVHVCEEDRFAHKGDPGSRALNMIAEMVGQGHAEEDVAASLERQAAVFERDKVLGEYLAMWALTDADRLCAFAHGEIAGNTRIGQRMQYQD